MTEKRVPMETGLGQQPYTAEDAATFHPPPSYEEVMAAYETSLNPRARELPPLAYIDIIPRCLSVGNIAEKIAPKFTPFSDIMAAANTWISDNPGVVVWKCETVQRKVSKERDGGLNFDLQNMLRHDATYGFQVYVRGVRLWLKQNPNPGSPPQQLALKNVLPATRDVLVPMRYRGFGGMMAIAAVNSAGETTQVNMVGQTFQTFEGLAKTIETMNKNLQSDPIPGSILNIETETIKAREGFKRSDLDPEASVWTEDKDKFRRFTQVIRIYYQVGTAAKEEIGLEQFVPELVSRGDSVKKPQFEPLSRTYRRLAAWLPSLANTGTRIVNIQQFDARVTKTWDDVEVSSDSTDEFEHSLGEVQMLKTIRVFTARCPSVSPPPIPPCLTPRLFLPVQTGARRCETMYETMTRIEAWLKVTGLPVYSVETVELLHSSSLERPAVQDSSDYTHFHSGKHWVTAIRLFFPVDVTEPDPSLLPPVPQSKSSSCLIL